MKRERLAATLIFALSSNFSSSTGKREGITKKKKGKESSRKKYAWEQSFQCKYLREATQKSAAHMAKRFQAQRNTFLLSTLEPITGKLFLLSTSGGLLIRSLPITSCYKAAGYCNSIWTRSRASRWEDTVVLTSSVKNGYLTQPWAMGMNICSAIVLRIGPSACVL